IILVSADLINPIIWLFYIISILLCICIQNGAAAPGETEFNLDRSFRVNRKIIYTFSFGSSSVTLQHINKILNFLPVCNFFLGGVSTDYHISQGFCLR